jgi:hypothetical protein
VKGDNVTRAWWTPYGLLTRLLQNRRDQPISEAVLKNQAMVGLVLAVVMMVFF